MGSAGWGVRLDGNNGCQQRALPVGKLGAIGGGVDDLLALLRRHLAQAQDGAGHELATRRRKSMEFLYRAAPLLALRLGHVSQSFIALQHALALLRIHAVEVSQFFTIMLLHLRRKLTKSGFVLQRALLIRQRKTAVAIHPLRQMLLILSGSDHGIRRRSNWTTLSRSASAAVRRGTLWPVRQSRTGQRIPQSGILPRGVPLSKICGEWEWLPIALSEQRRCDKQKSQCRASTDPRWRENFHRKHVRLLNIHFNSVSPTAVFDSGRFTRCIH